MELSKNDLETTSKPNFPKSKTIDKSFKVIIIGDPCCGKTSLLMRVGEGKRNDKYDTTVGVDCRS